MLCLSYGCGTSSTDRASCWVLLVGGGREVVVSRFEKSFCFGEGPLCAKEQPDVGVFLGRECISRRSSIVLI